MSIIKTKQGQCIVFAVKLYKDGGNDHISCSHGDNVQGALADLIQSKSGLIIIHNIKHLIYIAPYISLFGRSQAL